MFSDHSGIKGESFLNTFGKLTNMWILNNTLLNNQWVTEEVTREIRKYSVMNEKEDTTHRIMGCSSEENLYL